MGTRGRSSGVRSVAAAISGVQTTIMCSSISQSERAPGQRVLPRLMAASRLLFWKLNGSRVTRVSVMRGCSRWKWGRRGISHCVATAGTTPRRSTLEAGSVDTVSMMADSSASSAGVSRSNRISPADVSCRRLRTRSNSRTPRKSSSAWIWWLTALCVRLSESAACVKLSVRADSSNAWSMTGEGILRRMSLILLMNS